MRIRGPLTVAALALAAVTASAGPVQVAGYRGEQLLNAAHVIRAGQALGLSLRAQTIGVMTAMGESSLIVVDHGDAAGPDSRGLFQQRARGWGSYADRMDPTISSTNFFRALIQIPGWEILAPTVAAHRTQRNADPFHYEQFWDSAVEVVTVLAGAKLPDVAPPPAGYWMTARESNPLQKVPHDPQAPVPEVSLPRIAD